MPTVHRQWEMMQGARFFVRQYNQPQNRPATKAAITSMKLPEDK